MYTTYFSDGNKYKFWTKTDQPPQPEGAPPCVNIGLPSAWTLDQPWTHGGVHGAPEHTE